MWVCRMFCDGSPPFNTTVGFFSVVSETLEHFSLFLPGDFAFKEDVPAVREMFSAEAALSFFIVDWESVGDNFEVKALHADVGKGVDVELFEFHFVLLEHFFLVGSYEVLLLPMDVVFSEESVVSAIQKFLESSDSGVGVVNFGVEAEGARFFPWGKDDVVFDFGWEDVFVEKVFLNDFVAKEGDVGRPLSTLFDNFVVVDVSLVSLSEFVVDADRIVQLASVLFEEGKVIVCETALSEPGVNILGFGGDVVPHGKEWE